MAERSPRERELLPLTLAVPRGRAVVRQGEACMAMWIVETGALIAKAVAVDGRALALDVLGPGDAVGEPEGATSPVTVRAIRDCRLRPVWPAAVPGLLAARVERATAAAFDLAWLDVPARVRARMDDLSERFGRPVPGGMQMGLSLSQDDLAALTGTTRESANRALRAMQRKGLIYRESRGRYVVVRDEVRVGLRSVGA